MSEDFTVDADFGAIKSLFKHNTFDNGLDINIVDVLQKYDVDVFLVDGEVYSEEQVLALFSCRGYENISPKIVLDRQIVAEYAGARGIFSQKDSISTIKSTLEMFVLPANRQGDVTTETTRVFIGGEGWDDFKTTCKVLRCFKDLLPQLEAARGPQAPPMLAIELLNYMAK